MTFRAVFFDLGGTLFHYGDVRAGFDQMLAELVDRTALDAPMDEVRQVYREAMGRRMAEYVGRTYYLHRDMFAAAQADLFAHFGHSADPGHALYEGQVQVGLTGAKPRDGVHETLAGLRERGLHLGIVSNIDDDQFEPLFAELGLAPYFDATTTSEAARSCKPDPGIYRVALERAAGVDPAEVLFVGDSLEHDVAGARPLGMTTAWITSPRQRAAREADLAPELRPDHVIHAIPELLAIVDA